MNKWRKSSSNYITPTGAESISLGSVGSNAVPALVWLDDLDTGLYYVGSGAIGFSSNGIAKGQFSPYGLRFNALKALGSVSSLTLDGGRSDEASATAVIVDNVNAFTAAGTKLLSVRNAMVEKAFVSKDGIIGTGTLIANAAGTVEIANDSADTAEANAGWLEVQTLNGTRYRVPVWGI